jgi:predicted nucleic-acid-binding Zn-ribbon protein
MKHAGVNNLTHPILSRQLIETQIGSGNDIVQQSGGRAMVIRNIPGTVKCPECGSENVKSELSITTIVARIAKLLGVPIVKIYEKRCVECGHEFLVFRKQLADPTPIRFNKMWEMRPSTAGIVVCP